MPVANSVDVWSHTVVSDDLDNQWCSQCRSCSTNGAMRGGSQPLWQPCQTMRLLAPSTLWARCAGLWRCGCCTAQSARTVHTAFCSQQDRISARFLVGDLWTHGTDWWLLQVQALLSIYVLQRVSSPTATFSACQHALCSNSLMADVQDPCCHVAVTHLMQVYSNFRGQGKDTQLRNEAMVAAATRGMGRV